LLAEHDVRAVVIATPASTHFDLVGMALSAGKHVLCEKPFTRTVDEAQELERHAKAIKRILMIGHVFLFNAGIQYAQKVCAEGELGTLRYAIATRTNFGPVRTDVDVAADLASHDIAVLNWIAGHPPTTVSAVRAAYVVPDHADTAFITLNYPNGFTAAVHASWLHPEKVRRLTIVGSERMLVWNDLDLEAPVTIYDKHIEAHPQVTSYGDFLRVSTHSGEVRHPFVQLLEPLKVQASSFIDAIAGRPTTTGDVRGAVVVMNVLDAIRHSFAAHGQPIQVHT
jgi:predicted dehydrogenase